MKNLTRRSAIKKSIKAAAVAVSVPTFLPSSVLGLGGKTGPNSRIAIGLIGHGKIMKDHRQYHLGRDSVEVVALCDVDQRKLDLALAEVKEKTGKTCPTYEYYEELCDRSDIDGVVVGTPDHWHAQISIEAMKNGKDVYVEKPMTLTIEEGKVMRETLHRYGSVLQVGSQQRSNSSFRKAAELVLNGYIGKVRTVLARLGKFPAPSRYPEQPIPTGFNYDRWLGPAPWEPYNIERVKGDYGGGWRSFWDYGSRKNGDWGAHHYDIIQWALGRDDSGPVEFVPKGHEGVENQYYVYDDGVKVIRGYVGRRQGAQIHFVGEEGEVMVSRGDEFETKSPSLKNVVLKSSDIRLYESSDHRADWLNAIRTRKQPICNVNIGHRSATICQLSGISERLGRPIHWDPVSEQIVGDTSAAKWMSRPRRAPYGLLG
tara:strand:+ start:521 stop:1804 length:1284 start_codon:yes stop_codon:yes gene_type:complete